jgi:hypothetical protein
MTSALTRYTENMALRKQGLEDVWWVHWACFLKPLEELASELSVCLMDTDFYRNKRMDLGFILLRPVSSRTLSFKP